MSTVKSSKKGSLIALLPAFVFVVCYLISILLCNFIPEVGSVLSSYNLILSFIISLIVALFQNKNITFKNKLSIIKDGITDKSIIFTILILFMAGAFSGVVGQSSAKSVAYFMLDIVPEQYAVGVLFFTSCLVSLAMGTSVGSISVVVPIAIMVSNMTGHNIVLSVASVVGGSMFGDNLSMISDTTIAACTGQDCSLKDKFVVNSKICIFAALISLFIIVGISHNQASGEISKESYELVEFIPYILVLVLGIIGINVFIVLGIGLISGVFICAWFKQMQIIDIIFNMINGASSMLEINFLILIVASIACFIKKNGGFDFIINKVRIFCKSPKSSMLGVGVIVSLIDMIVANNTVAIVISNPIAKQISKIYGIHKKRMASLIDVFACIAQGLIPYGAQIIMTVKLCENAGIYINSFSIVSLSIYQFVLLVITVIGILTGIIGENPLSFKKIFCYIKKN